MGSAEVQKLTCRIAPTDTVNNNITTGNSTKGHDNYSNDDKSENERPLVLMIGWLNSKPKHLKHYAAPYAASGYETLAVTPKAQHILIPSMGAKFSGSILDVLSDKALAQRPILMHGFSVGAYLCGQMQLVFLERERALLANHASAEAVRSLRPNVVGQIWDSAIDVEGIPDGISTASTTNPFYRDLIKWALRGAMNINQSAMRQWQAAADAYKTNHLGTPIHMISSEADLVAISTNYDKAVEDWRSLGYDATHTRYKSSGHVSHLRAHPEAYVKDCAAFCSRVGLNMVL